MLFPQELEHSLRIRNGGTTTFFWISQQRPTPDTPRPITLFQEKYGGILEYSGTGEEDVDKGVHAGELQCGSCTIPQIPSAISPSSVSCRGIHQPTLGHILDSSGEIDAELIALLRQATVLPAGFGDWLRVTGKQVVCYHASYQQPQGGPSFRLSIDIFDFARLWDDTMLVADAAEVIER
ncbi:MAG: hypothetical protein M1830_003259 [Pleopsidium flavum]|nr:MAG: hypothetical protein M1830_003259 [Pleopsidium flavum]